MEKLLLKLSDAENSLIIHIKKPDVVNTGVGMEIYNKYKEIYLQYSEFYKKTHNLEALKRIIFIQWYAVVEPMTLTGIGELDQDIEEENLRHLYNLIINKEVDKEFLTMILHYYYIGDWYFNSFCDFSEALNSIAKQECTSFLVSQFKDRGQMGHYWNSLNSAH
ncbi:hypothetical protein [Mucilaginibacter sp.]|uniref:hypothetical protein n=1 Tax=Mucilaginibacter sp. TaxID=1882438 RepID=UPI00260670F3|nr:hypothetical protein [Mucilaginibacter sp.]MDB5127440.1 hypothetical protein [Mucilaginibacter sp.]